MSDRNTPLKDGILNEVPLAAGAVVGAGKIVVNTSSYATAGITGTGLVYLGISVQAVDNSGGGKGDEVVLVNGKSAAKLANSESDPVTAANIGALCYIVDDETVAATDGTGTRSAAGKVVQVDEDGVWVKP